MKERYLYERDFPRWLKWLGGWRVNKDSVDFKWGYFAPRFGFELKVHQGGYFDKRWAISFCPIWGHWHFYLPFDSGIESCSPPEYGVAIHNDTFWIYLGGEMDKEWDQCNERWITWDLPWFSWKHDFHRWKSPDGTWVEGGWENKDNAYSEIHEYTYTLANGEVQKRKATIREEERQWHRRWFPWAKNIARTIDVEFDGEVGERTGSWKGGVLGCGYDMKENETPEQTLRRMEQERKFN